MRELVNFKGEKLLGYRNKFNGTLIKVSKDTLDLDIRIWEPEFEKLEGDALRVQDFFLHRKR